MNWLLQLGWALRRRLYGWLRVRTHGVKVMLFNPAGELLLIRNSYGDPEAFVLPGGGKGWREQPLDAALRELREEVGVDDAALRHLGDYQSTAEGKRDQISLFGGTSAKAPQAESVEIAEARFCPLDALPGQTSAATQRRVAEWRRGGPFGGAW